MSGQLNVVTGTDSIEAKITVRIIGIGFSVEVSKVLGADESFTLEEALDLAGQTVDPTAVYRTSADVISLETPLADNATVLVAKPESNG